MNRMLITGLPLSDPDPSHAPCNIDYLDLFLHPSYILWADKIILPNPVMNIIQNGIRYEKGEDIVLKLIIDMLDAAGFIEKIDSSSLLTPSVWKSLDCEIDSDIKLLKGIYPQKEDDDEHMVLWINNKPFCYPIMRYVYASLYLSQKLDCHCLFNQGAIALCNGKFGITKANVGLQSDRVIQGVSRVFNSVLPDEIWSPYKLLSYECQNCVHRKGKCFDEIVSNTEKEIALFLEWREYDEIKQIKEVVDEIIKKKNKYDGIVSPEEIRQEFESRKRKLNTAIHKRFPKLRRWSNCITYLSVPATIASACVGDPALTITSASISAASLLTSAITESLSEKHNWVNFSLKNIQLPSAEVTSEEQ